MDIVAVLTRVVQAQQAALAELRAELAALRQAAGRGRPTWPPPTSPAAP
jgi:hypothetical protein